MAPSSSQHRSQGRSTASTKASRQAELQEAKAQAADALERAARFGDQTHHVNPRSPSADLSPTARARMLRSPKLATPYAASSSSSMTGALGNNHFNSQQHMYATPKPRGSSSSLTHTGGGVSPATSRGRHLTPSTVTAPTLSSSLKMSAPTAAASIRNSVSPTGRRSFNFKADSTTHRRSPSARPSSNNREKMSQTPSHPHNTPLAAVGRGGRYLAAKSSARASSSPKSPMVVGLRRACKARDNSFRFPALFLLLLFV